MPTSRSEIPFKWAIARIAALMLAMLAVSPPSPSLADEPEIKADKSTPDARKKKSERPTLDDALLKDLDNELLEGAGDQENRPRPKSGAARSTGRDHPRPSAEAEGEDIGMPGEDADPLTRISQQMRSVEALISERAEQGQAEQLQQRIIRDLAQLIEQTEQQSSQKSSAKNAKEQQTAKRQAVRQPRPSQQGPAGNESNKPAADSTDRLGKAEPARPDPELLKTMMKDAWGHLPQKTREQMLQNSPERFLPKYELMIERYYKRLAEERSSK